eukprot:COSAG02_NODE_52299_length_308_cov_1.464115_1_plen_21_part_10
MHTEHTTGDEMIRELMTALGH